MKRTGFLSGMVLIVSIVLAGCAHNRADAGESNAGLAAESNAASEVSSPSGDNADVIQFGDKWLDKDGLSEETIKWLENYNKLSEEEQLAISYVPHDLYEKCGYAGAEDSEANEADTQEK